MSEIILGGPHYICVGTVDHVSEGPEKHLRKHRLTMCTVPEAPESTGRSQEHLPCVHGTDQSFAASARRPAARTRVRQNAAEGFMEKGILR